MSVSYGLINDRSPHIIADLAEIICWHERQDLSLSDIEQILTQYGGDGLWTEIRQNTSTDSAEVNGRTQSLAEEIFRHFRYRQDLLKDWYPYKIDADIISLLPNATPKHSVYRALLSYSRLKMFDRTSIDRFAKDFETLCVHVAKQIAPGWDVFHLGKGGADRAKFGQRLKDVYRHLASITYDPPMPGDIEAIPDRNTGDGGLDIILMRQWQDQARGLPMYLAQCAAQATGWPEKIYESHSISHEYYINFHHKPGAILFIPVLYRDLSGQWIDNYHSSQVILIDRLRIIELLQKPLTSACDETVLAGQQVLSEIAESEIADFL